MVLSAGALLGGAEHAGRPDRAIHRNGAGLQRSQGGARESCAAEDAAEDQGRRLLAIGIGSLALVYYVFGALQKRITAPLVKMTAVAEEVITTSDWSLRAPTTEYRDIGVLVNAFNAACRCTAKASATAPVSLCGSAA